MSYLKSLFTHIPIIANCCCLNSNFERNLECVEEVTSGVCGDEEGAEFNAQKHRILFQEIADALHQCKVS